MLGNMKENLLSEETNDLAQNTEDQAQCNSTITNLQQEIEEASVQASSDEKEIKEKQISKDDLEAQLQAIQEEKDSKESELQSLQAQRDKESRVFEASKEQYSTTLSALYDGRSILKQLNENSASFLQTSKSFQEKRKKALFSFSNKVQSSLISQPGVRSILSFISLRIQSPELQADTELFQKVLEIIDSLISELDKQADLDKETEEGRESLFQKEKIAIEEELVGLNGQITQLAQEIKILNDNIENLKSDLKNQKDKVDENNQVLEDKQRECSQLERSYEERSENRKSEIEIIDQAVNIFETRFEDVSKYIEEIEV